MPLSVGWVPPILPYIEQNPLYQLFQTNKLALLPTDKAEAELLNCPSRNPTNSFYPLSYVVNCGMQDESPSASVVPRQYLDYQQNGVFFDQFTPTIPTYANVQSVTTDLAYMSKHDGTSNTLMLSENLDALDWINNPLTNPASNPVPPPQSDYKPPQIAVLWGGMHAGESWWQGFTWFVAPMPNNWGMDGASPTGIILNKNINAVVNGVQSPTSDPINGRPSSSHSGGFIGTFCDGRSRFLGEDIDYRVYCLLMAPDNSTAANPYVSSSAPSTVQYPLNWYSGSTLGNPLNPVSASDLDK